MTDQPVTPDREALGAIVEAALRRGRWNHPQQQASVAVDALLPLLTEALDRARQQGRDELMAEQRADADEFMANLAAGKVRLARGGPNRKDEE